MTRLQTTSEGPRRPRPASGSRSRLFRLTEAAVSITFAVPIGELQAATRCRADAAFARQVTMYLARVVFGMRYSAIGRLCGRDHTTVAHACGVVEERRDDPAINRVLRMLEHLCWEMSGEVADVSAVRT